MNDQKMELVTCECGNEVGHVGFVEGKEVLFVNGVMVRALHGACQCGRPFHFSTGDRMMAELLRLVQNLRQGSASGEVV